MDHSIPALEQKMLARTRKHMLTSFAGIGLGILLMGSAGALAHSQFAGQKPPAWFAVLPMLGLVMMPGIGWYSAYKNLRCPSCNRWVAFLVSSNYSIFSSMASKHCPGCGKKIFGDELGKRFRRMVVVMVALGVGLFALGGVMAATHRPAPRPAAAAPASPR